MIPRFLANLIGVGRVTIVDDSGELQLMQVTEGAKGKGFVDRVTDRVRRVTEFGFTSVPPIGAEIMILRREGDRAKPVVIATSHRPSRIKNLQPGDVCVYDSRGAYVKFTADGIVIEPAGQPVTLNGDLHVTGDVVSRSGGAPVSLNGVRDAYVVHKHIGVSTGTGVSGISDHIAV